MDICTSKDATQEKPNGISVNQLRESRSSSGTGYGSPSCAPDMVASKSSGVRMERMKFRSQLWAGSASRYHPHHGNGEQWRRDWQIAKRKVCGLGDG